LSLITSMSKKKRVFILVLGLMVITLLALSPGLVRETSKSDFCLGCHVMESQYEDWFKTGLHRTIKCVDCHLPNDNIFSHLFWKAVDGTKDVIYFYGRLYTDRITISNHGRQTIQANCIRCHGEMVSGISLDGNRNCWSCHRRTSHTFPQTGTTTF
jgi:cytochrome c nitrite reductase small subunit